jgi:hypothetical protein
MTMKRMLVRSVLLVAVACAPVLCCGQSTAPQSRDAKEGRPTVIQTFNYYLKAAEQGDAYAQAILGTLYLAGRGVQQNYTEAVKWYRKAAEQGFAGAQASLGLCYMEGFVVPQDFVEAYKWLNLAAAELPRDYFVKLRDDLLHRMTPEQIAEGQKRTAGFIAQGGEVKVNNYEQSIAPSAVHPSSNLSSL